MAVTQFGIPIMIMGQNYVGYFTPPLTPGVTILQNIYGINGETGQLTTRRRRAGGEGEIRTIDLVNFLHEDGIRKKRRSKKYSKKRSKKRSKKH